MSIFIGKCRNCGFGVFTHMDIATEVEYGYRTEKGKEVKYLKDYHKVHVKCPRPKIMEVVKDVPHA